MREMAVSPFGKIQASFLSGEGSFPFHTLNWFPGIYSPHGGQKISGAFTRIVGTHRAKPQLVKIPDMPIGQGPTGIPGNQKSECCNFAGGRLAS
jgi:hypothetical protein